MNTLKSLNTLRLGLTDARFDRHVEHDSVELKVSSPLVDAHSKTTISTLELLSQIKVRPSTSMGASKNIQYSKSNAYTLLHANTKSGPVLE